jgi:hypothetical protein
MIIGGDNFTPLSNVRLTFRLLTVSPSRYDFQTNVGE